LAVGCWVCVFIGSEQGTQGRSHIGATHDVKGAVLDIVPEQHSQTDCGSVHSACNHRRPTMPGKLTMFVQGGMPVHTQEGSDDELAFLVE
jgi:hypothetical protein